MPLSPTPPPTALSVSAVWKGGAAVLAAVAAVGVFTLAMAGGASILAAIAAAVVAAAAVYLARGAAPAPAAARLEAQPDPGALGPLLLPALEALPDPLLLVAGSDPDDAAGRRILYANAPARALLRIPHEGALLVSAMRRPEVLETIDQSLFTGAAAEVTFETGAALERSWRAHALPLEGTGENRRLALVMMRDETDVRRNERMRADFLANASHELRTPLASLMGFVDTLRGHAKDDPAARDRFLGIMAEQAARMRRLLDDLLALSRIELNEHVPPSAVCDLAGATADVVDALSPVAAEKGVVVDFDRPAEAEIVGDYDQIVQVVQNLLANAIKYAPAGSHVRIAVSRGLSLEAAQAGAADSPRRSAEGGGRLRLLAPDRAEGERYALVTVNDGGPGMRRENLPRLSERFYRVEGQKSGDRQGTGLGLAIVKHIINRHRGGLNVESAPGLGAEFGAYFPMSAAR
jgi:two-component system phosphate regulon sensor histidine kinase PhoR